jgi:TatD DNase family protein
MLIDTHCHLPLEFAEYTRIIEDARKARILKFITIGTSIADSQDIVNVFENVPDVYCTVGVYPHEDTQLSLGEIGIGLEKLIARSSKVVGIGECGIDLKNGLSPDRTVGQQQELFDLHIKLALKHNLPIVIHNREGDDAVLEVVEKHVGRGLRGVLHCFSSTWDYAKKMLDLGFYISFGGKITYPSSNFLLDTVRNVPLDRFLLETDAPWLPPQGHRGEVNEPKYVKIVAEKVAAARNLQVSEVSECSTKNAHDLFGIPI